MSQTENPDDRVIEIKDRQAHCLEDCRNKFRTFAHDNNPANYGLQAPQNSSKNYNGAYLTGLCIHQNAPMQTVNGTEEQVPHGCGLFNRQLKPISTLVK